MQYDYGVFFLRGDIFLFIVVDNRLDHEQFSKT